jgi:uncharacterized SAM-dependent methyltransferase
MNLISLECVLMDNRELMFNGRSLGFLSEEEIKQFTTKLINNET